MVVARRCPICGGMYSDHERCTCLNMSGMSQTVAEPPPAPVILPACSECKGAGNVIKVTGMFYRKKRERIVCSECGGSGRAKRCERCGIEHGHGKLFKCADCGAVLCENQAVESKVVKSKYLWHERVGRSGGLCGPLTEMTDEDLR